MEKVRIDDSTAKLVAKMLEVAVSIVIDLYR